MGKDERLTVHKTLMNLMGRFSSANVYKDRSNSKFGVYWYHILVCIGTSTNTITPLFLTRITSWIHASYLGDLYSEKAFVQALGIPNFCLFVLM